ncbi:MAG TPA: glutamate racemase [Anaerovoracaceae bacterium]|nr:glutamate racemase [Anaerovoracaceae bacterium]
MDNRPIGFFDSGLGGLTSIPHLMKQLPKERIIFFGDTARTPYGSKSPDTIRQFTMQIGEFLVKQNVKMIVIACNTVSATCLEDLRKAYPNIPVISAISPTARVVAKECVPSDRIGIIATKVTIHSNAYEKKINEKKPGLTLFSKACPAFVPLIEEGIIDNEIMDLTIKYYLDDFVHDNNLNTLVLGCTHYPLIAPRIKNIYPQLRIINSSKEVATAVTIELEKNDMFAGDNDNENVFYASDLSENFTNMISKILKEDQENLNIKFKNLDL